MTITVENLKFCDDCLQAIANDDYSGISYSLSDDAAIDARISEIQAGMTAWTKAGFYLVAGSDSDEFSTRQCDCCRTRDAGRRHDGTALYSGLQP